MAPTDPFAAKSAEELLAQLQELSARKPGFDPAILALKEEIVRRNIGLVKSIAAEFASSGELFEDLVQAGYLGLLNAVHNFDCARGVKFSTYATHLVKGEIRHHIRDKHLVRVPAWLKALSEDVKAAEGNYFVQWGRFPTISELAKVLNISEEGIVEVLKARDNMTYVSLDAERRAEDPRPRIDVAKIRSRERRGWPLEYRIRIAMAIDTLSDLQRRVIHGLFYVGKSQSEVAKEIGYSQRHVSRLKDESLRRIEQEIKEDLEKKP